jgi:endonuclease/exonuclease/phosphatase family metal-dependent hydrolase
MTASHRAALVLPMVLWLASSQTARAQAARITIDGMTDDWQSLEPIYTDPSGEAAPEATDFGRLWCANDERHLFLRVEVGVEINLQDFNTITLYLDADNDASTGIPIGDMGADLAWTFGERTGTFVANGEPVTIGHAQIGLVSAPTVSASQFEIAIDRHAYPDGVTALFSTGTIRIVMVDGTVDGDTLPDAQSVRYIFDEAPLPPIEPHPLQKRDDGHVRILSYNVEFDGLFHPARVEAYSRILQAIRPNVIGFQEIYGHTASQTVRQVVSMLPPDTGQQWYSAQVADTVAVSQFRIVSSFNISNTGNGAFLLDLRPRYDSNLLLIVAHPPCCQDNEARQRELDAIMAFVRDARERGGLIALVPNTPIILMGDFNLVGFSQQLRTLLTGDIVNTAFFGPGFAPDWDDSALSDLRPRHPDQLMTYTWRSDASMYPPGRLDFMIYTDSVIEPGNRFALFTGDMSDEMLAANGLHRSDASVASDHLPLVGDFMLPAATSGAVRQPEFVKGR